MGNTCSKSSAAEDGSHPTTAIKAASNGKKDENKNKPARDNNSAVTPANKANAAKTKSSPTKKPASKGAAKKPSPGVRGGAAAKKKKNNKQPGVPEEYWTADPSKWKLVECKFAGSAAYETLGKKEDVKKPIEQGLQEFKAHPGKYVAMMYQADMDGWPKDQQQFSYIHRMGTLNYKPQGVSPTGWMNLKLWNYEALPPLKDDVLPAKFRDKYTDAMTHCRRKLHTHKNKPVLPGRGMGVCDSPLVKIIGDVDPSDIHQGMVGDCWLLSAISALAEFDGAIKKLFRKTQNLERRPLDGPNRYTVTLWDLPTWKEVDIVVDERLAVAPDGSGRLLASRPSEDGELWVCYLEKALAMHCGGWDKITGGQCTHGWALMTGCRNQYMISKNNGTGKYKCSGLYNPVKKEWNRHANSPHDGDQSMWPVEWPEVGGGGNKELSEDELFLRLVAWDQENYIVAAGTKGKSDKNTTGGLVDNHAYTVIESHSNVCGTGIDLLKVRNPWGKGEIEDGEFDDDGPGWDKYPQIKKKLKPVVADDGIFWVTKKEFFHFYQTIYLGASNMTEFLED